MKHSKLLERLLSQLYSYVLQWLFSMCLLYQNNELLSEFNISVHVQRFYLAIIVSHKNATVQSLGNYMGK